MGIRFACHSCRKPLNIKAEFAGKRGVCPQCGNRFRIPQGDSELSIPLEEAAPIVRVEVPNTAFTQAVTESSEKASPLLLGSNGSLRSLLDDETAVWYVRPPSGGQYGPATGDLLRSWIAEARVTSTSLIWRDGWPQWRSAGEVLTEFGAEREATPEPQRNTVRERYVGPAPVAPTLSGDPTIGARKSGTTNRRFMMVGTLAAISITLVGVLIYLLQR